MTGLGSNVERKRLELLNKLIDKRREIRDRTLWSLEELIVFCDCRLLEMGGPDLIARDTELQKMASLWQKSILDIEKQKVLEDKEMFRDTLFLKSEMIKSTLSYFEEKQLDILIRSIAKG